MASRERSACAGRARGAAIIRARRPVSGRVDTGAEALDAQQPESTEPTSETPDVTGATPPSTPDPEAAQETPPSPPPPGDAPPPPPAGSKAGTPPPDPKAKAKAKAKKPKPPGLIEQLRNTGRAAGTLVMAHMDLAKEEASSIGRESGKFAGMIAAAVGLVIMAALLLIIGSALFIGEWLLGSIGWGVLHGVLAFLSIAVALILLGLGVSAVRIGRALLIAVIVGVLTSIVLGAGLLNQAYAAIGDSLGIAVPVDLRPLIVGVAIGAIVGLVTGIVVAVQVKDVNRFVAIAGGIVFGVLVGALTSITYGPQVGAGIGITLGYLTWMGLMGIDVYRTGIDMEALKARFTPQQTIDTSKETLEWLQKRMPRGNGS